MLINMKPHQLGTKEALMAQILYDNPVGYWVCDDSDMYSGTILDYSGNGFDAAITGTILYNDRPLLPDGGKYVRCYQSGAAYGKVGDGAIGTTIPMTGSYSACALIHPTVTTGFIKAFTVVANGENSAQNAQFMAYLDDCRPTTFWEYGSGSDVSNISVCALKVWRTYMVHWVKDAAQQQLRWYVNGLNLIPATYTIQPDGGSSADSFIFGDVSSAGTDAVMGHIAFFDYALTEQRIREHVVAAGRMSGG